MIDQTGEGEWAVAIVLGVIALAVYGGVSFFERVGGSAAPKVINADGQTYLACRDQISVTAEGGGLLGSSDIFRISFTDASGLSHTLRGVHKLEISDIPKLVDAPMPLNPGLVDRDGKPVTEDNT